MSGVASSLNWHAWHKDSVGRANGPNDCTPQGDDMPGCLEIVLEFGGFTAIEAECMPCKTSVGTEGQIGTRSPHPGGVFAAYADGSVHWIGNDLETSEECCSTWDRLVLATDGLSFTYP